MPKEMSMPVEPGSSALARRSSACHTEHVDPALHVAGVDRLWLRLGHVRHIRLGDTSEVRRKRVRRSTIARSSGSRHVDDP